MSNYNSHYVSDHSSSIIDDEDRPFFLRKIWCHGQSVLPPIIAICFSAYAFREEEDPPPRGVAIVVSILLCAWPFVSWMAVTEGSTSSSSSSSRKNHYRLLRGGGALVLAVYICIVATTISRTSHRGLGLLLIVFSSLAAIETVAFLAVVTCMRSLFSA
mmetsp:Transcript_21284/g.50330  ORF Transcript_21284/g.50330 Transcript_21284/m.50330 type:complete len:159 (+) Transcript_21284:168-644(+)